MHIEYQDLSDIHKLSLIVEGGQSIKIYLASKSFESAEDRVFGNKL